MASGSGYAGNCGHVGSRWSIGAFRSARSRCGSHRTGLLVLEARRLPSSGPGREAAMPRLPTGKTIRLPCHVPTDWTSRLASNERRAALGYPRRKRLSGTYSQFEAVGARSENLWSHLSEGRVDRGKRISIALRRCARRRSTTSRGEIECENRRQIAQTVRAIQTASCGCSAPYLRGCSERCRKVSCRRQHLLTIQKDSVRLAARRDRTIPLHESSYSRQESL